MIILLPLAKSDPNYLALEISPASENEEQLCYRNGINGWREVSLGSIHTFIPKEDHDY